MKHWIEPDWDRVSGIRSCFTTRDGGYSTGAYRSLNLGLHVGDTKEAVQRNRDLLQVPGEPFWLDQQHSARCVDADTLVTPGVADASFSREPGRVLAVMVADCLPILMARADGGAVAVIHAGWRGLADGVIENTLSSLPGGPWHAWLGPAIGPCHYEVGEEVLRAIGDPSAFSAASEGKWMLDLYAAARQKLNGSQVLSVSGGEYCTYCDAVQFYSYRRDGVTGRMAGLIWRDP